MKLTFTSAEEARKFWRIRKRKRNRFIKKFFWTLWGIGSMAGIIWLFSLAPKVPEIGRGKSVLTLLAFVSAGMFTWATIVNTWLRFRSYWELEREAKEMKEEEKEE